MRPPAFERLLAAVSPHGIDLVQAAVEAHNGLPLNARRRRALYAQCAGIDIDDVGPIRPGLSARGKQTRSMRKRLDPRLALRGLEGPPYLAACHSYLLDDEVKTDLYWSLIELAGQLGRADKKRRWPIFVPRQDGRNDHWVERLCEIVLIRDRYRDIFNRIQGDMLYMGWLNVTEDIWRAMLKSPCTALLHSFDNEWLARAAAHVHRGIEECFRHQLELDALLEAS